MLGYLAIGRQTGKHNIPLALIDFGNIETRVLDFDELLRFECEKKKHELDEDEIVICF